MKFSKNSSETFFSRYDSRNDLGYGRNSNKFHKPRSLNNSFPYREQSSLSQEDDFDEEEESLEAIASKLYIHTKSDPFSRKSTNPFYFAAGNTKLADCFFRTEEVLKEIHVMANSLVPIPSMTKKRSSFGGGARTAAGAISAKTFRRTGSEKGYASSPPEIKYDKNVNDEDEVIFNLEDLVKKLKIQTGNFRT